jgi:hypothetical protein
VITVGKPWMAQLKTWIFGQKHPETPRQVFLNVHDHDRVRRVLLARCKICDYVVSRDAKAVRELVFTCSDQACQCRAPLGSRAHEVCLLCYDMYHALYVNYGMRSLNYFREIDDRYRSDFEDFKKRNRK